MATVPSNVFWNIEAKAIEEILNRNITVMLPALSPTFKRIKTGNFQLMSNPGFGRDRKILKLFTSAMGGVLEEGGPHNDFTLYGDPLNAGMGRVYTQNVTSTFPDPFRGPTGRSFRLGIPLRTMVFSIGMTLDEMDSDVDPAVIRDIITPRFMGAARNISMTFNVKFFLDQKKGYSLTTFTTSSTLTDDTVNLFGQTGNAVLRVTVDNLAIHRFYTGQRLQIRTDNSGKPGTGNSNLVSWNEKASVDITGQDDADTIWFVQAVNPLKNYVYLSAEGNTGGVNIGTGGTNTGLDASTKYHLVNAVSFGANSYTQDTAAATSVASIYSWLKTGTGTSDTWGSGDYEDNFLLGGEADPANLINVKVDSMFMSYKKDLQNAPLTEHTLRRIIRSWNAAKMSLGQSIDTFLASDGVLMAYEAQKIHREIIDRTGRLPSLANEGDAVNTFRFSVDGKTYEMLTEPMMEANTVLGLKLGGGNFKVAIPPRVNSSGFPSKGNITIDNFIPFRLLTPILTDNPGRAFAPYFRVGSGGGAALLTLGRQAVGDIAMQIIPDQPAGMLLTNVAEDRIYAD